VIIVTLAARVVDADSHLRRTSIRTVDAAVTLEPDTMSHRIRRQQRSGAIPITPVDVLGSSPITFTN